MSSLEIVTVVNDFNCFDRTIKNNPFMNKYNITVFDNNKENIGISKRYNSYIKNNILNNKIQDSWIVFCHQDFAFLEDPIKELKKEDKDSLYGVIGVKKKSQFSLKFKKRLFPFRYRRKVIGSLKQGFHSSRYFSLNEDYFNAKKIDKIFFADTEFEKIGDELFFNLKNQNTVTKATQVDTVDCCCIIIHSSLFIKNKIEFDENLDFHLYTEDLSLNALFYHKKITKVLPIKSYHRGEGTLNKSFYDSLEYLKKKYKGKRFVGTCFNCDW